MQNASYGHAWKRHDGVAPCLLAGWRLVRRMAGVRLRLRYPFWVVDYAFNQLEEVRVGARGRPWHRRAPRTAHLYPPGTAFWERYPARPGTLSQCAYVAFGGGEAAGLGGLVHPRARYGRFLDPEGALGALIAEVARIGHEEREAGFWKAQAAFCALVDRLQRSEPLEDETRRFRSPAPAAEASSLVRATDAYLAGHLAEPVALPELAGHLHVSVSTLSHRYRDETGETPMGRLLRLRVDLAKALVVRGQPLKAVAEATGFSDAFHLSRTFKRLEGVAPREFLRGLRPLRRPGTAK